MSDQPMTAPFLPNWLIPRLPFFYGWVILGCVSCAGLSRQGGAVATLSVFVAPMTRRVRLVTDGLVGGGIGGRGPRRAGLAPARARAGP